LQRSGYLLVPEVDYARTLGRSQAYFWVVNRVLRMSRHNTHAQWVSPEGNIGIALCFRLCKPEFGGEGSFSQIRLTGKGRRTRIVPLMRNTVALLTAYLEEQGTGHPAFEELPLFLNTRRQPYTRSGITVMVQKYVRAARDQQPTLPERVTPHTFRHSKAMHMLQAGIPLIIIRDFLGHIDIKTSEIYARVDVDMKRRALERVHHTVTPPGLPAWEDDAALMEWLRSL
jgi:hypothetical protein